MQLRTSTLLRVSLPLSLAVLASTSMADAIVITPVTDHHWTFDEPSGTIAYDEYGGPNGNLGASTTRVTGPFGDNAVAITPTSTTDSNGFVDFGRAIGAIGTADFTIAHWYSTTFNDVGLLADVLGNRTAYSHGNFFSVRVRGDGTITAELDQDGWGTNYTAVWGVVYPINDGEWHHLAYVRQGAMLLLYIDGYPVDLSNTDSGNPTWISGASSFRIGNRLPNGYAVPAAYDDLRIYDYALSDEEILDLAGGAP